MATYTFRWDHPAQEVFVTGTFDNWQKTVRLNHNGSHFEKTVELPVSHEKILYKFVVDGHWTPDYNRYHEDDGSGNQNNVLRSEDLTHSSSHMPGEFPETPAVESSSFGVNPLPAFSGTSNPVNIAPGQALPSHDSVTSHTVGSNVRLDKDSYERSDAYPSSGMSSIPETGIFGVPPVTQNMIPESSLPMGSGTRGYETEDAGPTIRSAGAGTSTAELAGQVPKEPRGVPSVVHDSQVAAHQGPEAAGNSEAVMEKRQLEQELLSKVHPAQTTSESARDFNAPGHVPAPVTQSQQLAHQSPEAAANPEAVSEKEAMENELLNRVPKQNMSADTGSTIGDYAAAGAAAVGLTGAAAAIGKRVQDGQAESSSTATTTHFPHSFQEAASMLPTSVQSTLDKATNAVGNLTGLNAPADDVPAPVAHSIQQQVSRGPEAASNPEAVHEKSAVERELLSSIRPAQTSAENHPTASTSSISGSHLAGAAVPATVKDSFAHSSRGAEAGANPVAVTEKAGVEQELLASIPKTNASGEPAPSDSAALASAAPGTSSALPDGTATGMSSTGLRAPEDFARGSSAQALATPTLLDNDTAPAITAMSRDLNLSERPVTTSSNNYSAPSATTSTQQYSAPPAGSYSTHQQSVIDRVFGAPVAGSQTSAAPIVTGAAAGAAVPIAMEEAKREVQQPQTSAPPRTSSKQPLSSYANIQNSTYGGSSLAFQKDPVSAKSGSLPAMTSSTAGTDPRSVAPAFAKDPISAAGPTTSTSGVIPPTKATSSTAPTTQTSSKSAVTNPAVLAATAAASAGAAGATASRSAQPDRGLNASATDAAQTPATKATSSFPSTLRANKEEPRDVSPMNKGPSTTTGVSTTNTPAKSTGTTQTPTSTPAKSTTAGTTPSSSASTPSKAPPASGPRLDIPGDEKKGKRRSFFGKLKDRMSGSNEEDDSEYPEVDGEDFEEDGIEDDQVDSAVSTNSTTTQAMEHKDEMQGLLSNGQIDGKEEELIITAGSNESKQEQQHDLKEDIAAVAAEAKQKVSTHRNGAAFMMACLVAAAAITLVWRR